jgi:hypothetical protein
VFALVGFEIDCAFADFGDLEAEHRPWGPRQQHPDEEEGKLRSSITIMF